MEGPHRNIPIPYNYIISQGQDVIEYVWLHSKQTKKKKSLPSIGYPRSYKLLSLFSDIHINYYSSIKMSGLVIFPQNKKY